MVKTLASLNEHTKDDETVPFDEHNPTTKATACIVKRPGDRCGANISTIVRGLEVLPPEDRFARVAVLICRCGVKGKCCALPVKWC